MRRFIWTFLGLGIVTILGGCAQQSGVPFDYSASESSCVEKGSSDSPAYQQCVRIARGITIQNQVNSECASQGFKSGTMEFDKCAIAKKTELVNQRRVN